MVSTIEHYWPRTYSETEIIFWRIVQQFRQLTRQIDENMKKGVNHDDGTSSIVETINEIKMELKKKVSLHKSNPYMVTISATHYTVSELSQVTETSAHATNYTRPSQPRARPAKSRRRAGHLSHPSGQTLCSTWLQEPH